MSRALSTAFAGVGGAALLMAGTVSAQEAMPQDFNVQPESVSLPVDFTVRPEPTISAISDQWRVVVINPDQSLLRPPSNLINEDRYQENNIIRLQKSWRVGEGHRLYAQYDQEIAPLYNPERQSSGGLAGIASSRSLQISGSDDETGGRWGFRYKRRTLIFGYSSTF